MILYLPCLFITRTIATSKKVGTTVDYLERDETTHVEWWHFLEHRHLRIVDTFTEIPAGKGTEELKCKDRSQGRCGSILFVLLLTKVSENLLQNCTHRVDKWPQHAKATSKVLTSIALFPTVHLMYSAAFICWWWPVDCVLWSTWFNLDPQSACVFWCRYSMIALRVLSVGPATFFFFFIPLM